MPPKISKHLAAKKRLRILQLIAFFIVALTPLLLLVVLTAHLVARVSSVAAFFLLLFACLLAPIMLIAGDLAAIKLVKFCKSACGTGRDIQAQGQN